MGLRIDELICNVTVALGAGALPLAQARSAEEPARTEQAAPPLEQVLSRTISRPQAEQIMAATVARQTQALAAEGGVPSGVDPKALADKVYRLMREELEIARERG